MARKVRVIDPIDKQKHVRARRSDHRDQEVGKRVRARRLEQGLSQTDLADKIGVTFQQVQKYEKGVNRIGAGRLQRISETLLVPISFFFGASQGQTKESAFAEAKGDSVFGYLQSRGSVRVVKAMHKIKSRRARELIASLAEELAGIPEPD